jgi:hypothetical protein
MNNHSLTLLFLLTPAYASDESDIIGYVATAQ